MSFIDEYLPEEVPGYPCVSAPRTKTTIQASAGGTERRNQDWEHPLYRYILPEAAGRQPEVINRLRDHWLIMRGPFHSFPWRDPLDKATVDHVPNEPDASVIAAISDADQAIGVTDGFTSRFQLTKTYGVGAYSYVRKIHLPVVSTVVVALDGIPVSPSDYTVTRPGGEIVFDLPPPAGLDVTAGFLFDVEVRFESDDAFEGIVRTWQVGGFADINLVEVRPC